MYVYLRIVLSYRVKGIYLSQNNKLLIVTIKLKYKTVSIQLKLYNKMTESQN